MDVTERIIISPIKKISSSKTMTTGVTDFTKTSLITLLLKGPFRKCTWLTKSRMAIEKE
jgi:hypothetical protein